MAVRELFLIFPFLTLKNDLRTVNFSKKSYLTGSNKTFKIHFPKMCFHAIWSCNTSCDKSMLKHVLVYTF